MVFVFLKENKEMSFPVNVKYSLIFPIMAILWCLIHKLRGKYDANANTKYKEILTDNEFARNQMGVMKRGGLGIIINIISFIFSNKIFYIDSKNEIFSNQDCYNYTIKWFMFPVLSLIWGVMNIANKRFTTKNAILGKRTKELEMDQRYLANTLEQITIFFIINIIAMSSMTECSQYSWICLNNISFIVGRIFFWYGYLYNTNFAGSRAFGFSLTFQCSILTLIWCVYNFIINL